MATSRKVIADSKVWGFQDIMSKEMNDQKCYPFHMDYLPEICYQKALEELNETPETRVEELTKLKGLLSADKFTAGIEFEEDFLQLFLRYRKYNSSQAFQAVRKFVHFRRNFSSIFQSIPNAYFKENPSTKFISVLPNRCPDGCAVVLVELGKWNHNELSIEHIKTMGMFSFLLPLRCPMTQICGFKVIYDFTNTIKHFRYCTPQNISLIYNAGFNCVPGRYKETHCINESALQVAVWAVFKHFLSAKIRKRVFFHSKPEDLLNYFPKSIIPTQYGGSLENYHDSELMNKLNEEVDSYPEKGLPNYF
ncbi:Alpha-tocopherol transfer protein-like [Argiope bruennichi]|uniref:Alpha-tocopherol transfer protein-like n=1 Tax=Argiope bruennichi TaxID=94029 RepID=A0A8T0ETU5_ARGBR|nr:Alpha-tocopherol transfer protein-like [Argiope bruennichi]